MIGCQTTSMPAIRTEINAMKMKYTGKDTLKHSPCTMVDIVRHGNKNKRRTKTPHSTDPMYSIVPSLKENNVITPCQTVRMPQCHNARLSPGRKRADSRTTIMTAFAQCDAIANRRKECKRDAGCLSFVSGKPSASDRSSSSSTET